MPKCPFLYLCTDENGKDQGINIRQKVKEMVEFAQDDDRLREERKKAKKNKDKYVGVSSDSVGGFRYGKHVLWRGWQPLAYCDVGFAEERSSFILPHTIVKCFCSYMGGSKHTI